MPASKFSEATGLFDELWAWSKNEVVSICENCLASEFAHLGVRDSLYASASGGTNKSRRLDIAVWGVDDAGTHEAVLFFDFKSQHIMPILANLQGIKKGWIC